MARTHDAVTEIRQATTALLRAVERLQNLRGEWVALDYGSTLDQSVFVGENADTSVAELAAVIGTTLPAIEGLFGAGHATNLQKIRF